MKMIDHNHFICHLILGTFTEYPYIHKKCHITTSQHRYGREIHPSSIARVKYL